MRTNQVIRRLGRHQTLGILIVASAIAINACASEDNVTSEASSAPADPPTTTEQTPATTDAPSTSVDPVTTEAPDTAMSVFRADVTAFCNAGNEVLSSLPENNGTAQNAQAQIDMLRANAADVSDIDPPEDLKSQFDEIVAVADEGDETLTRAEEALAAGDVSTAESLIDANISAAAGIAARFALIGATCGPADATRAASADLSVPLESQASQIASGFGSIWVSEFASGNLVRVDPVTGDILARIAVGDGPLKVQPAGGRMWARTSDAYVRIDPATNAVDATLAKADVGPSANRSWATDGALWICDGRQLHRYDPTTVERIATVDLAVDCDQVYATSDLVITWVYDDEPGATREPVAVMVDPGANQVLSTVPLPVDVLAPVIFDDRIFFAGNYNKTAVVVDRASWTVSSTHDLGRITHGGFIVTDGASIFVPTRDGFPNDVLVVDAVTYTVTDTIEPLDVNGVALLDGSLWVTHETFNVAQRFDLPT